MRSFILTLFFQLTSGCGPDPNNSDDEGMILNGIPTSTRVHWMRRANEALAELVSPCPFGAFGSVIVNHTAAAGGNSAALGDEICIGANAIDSTGNPTLHGEMVAINTCVAALRAPPYDLDADATLAALADLTLYTNAEPCPMCASAIRWAGFRECVFGTDIDRLVGLGWSQILIPAKEVFERSGGLGTETGLLGNVLTDETDPYFEWQFDPSVRCPGGCTRTDDGCEPV